MIWAIDPGVNTGVAVFSDKNELIYAMLLDASDLEGFVMGLENIRALYGSLDVIIELPQIYPGRAQKGDPNDLISVAIIAGAATGYFSRWGNKPKLVKPHAWKGNVPKKIHNERILKKLSPTERALVDVLRLPASKIHNVIDAVGLGLWELGR